MLSLILFGGFLALLLASVPVAVALGAATVFAMLYTGTDFSLLPSIVYAGIEKFSLLAIPFFILAGLAMERGGVSRGLIGLVAHLVGHVRGGLAMVSVLSTVLFGGISGSGPADTAAIGTPLIPAMVRRGYSPGFAAATVAAGATTDILIPPSIAFIVYGVIAETSITALFIAGVVPGLLLGMAYLSAAYLVSRREGYGGERVEGEPLGRVLVGAVPGFGAIALIIGGIYSGFFTPTEAAAVAAVYGLAVGLFVTRQLRWGQLRTLFAEAAVGSAVVLTIVALAGAFAWMVTTQGLAQAAGALLRDLAGHPVLVLVAVNVLLLAAGMVMDAVSIYYVSLPILLPLVDALGLSRLWFGAAMTLNLAIGQITPPVAVNLFIAANIARVGLAEASRWVWPYLVGALIVLGLVTYLPELSLWLPRLLVGAR
ncbi:MAG TPA: TRAP transporter large permease [Thermodesulfobacteriota bacterium]